MNQYPTSEGNNRPSGRHPDPPTGPIHGHYDHTMSGYGAGQPPQYGYQQGPPPQGFGPPPKQGMSTGVVVLITVLVVVVIGLLVGGGIPAGAPNDGKQRGRAHVDRARDLHCHRGAGTI